MKKRLVNLSIAITITAALVAHKQPVIAEIESPLETFPVISMAAYVPPQRAFTIRRGDAMSKQITLSRGKFAIVDDEDYEQLSKYNWFADLRSYNCYTVRNVLYKTKRTQIYMHREIMNFPENKDVHHIDHNGLNNRKSNLQICEPDVNKQRVPLRIDNKSGYKGVCWSKSHQKWQVAIQGKIIGRFNNKTEAAKAYDEAAERLFGKFAVLNFAGAII